MLLSITLANTLFLKYIDIIIICGKMSALAQRDVEPKGKIGVVQHDGSSFYVRSGLQGHDNLEVLGRQVSARYVLVTFRASFSSNHKHTLEPGYHYRLGNTRFAVRSEHSNFKWKNLTPWDSADEAKLADLERSKAAGHTVELIDEKVLSMSFGMIGQLFIVYAKAPSTTLPGSSAVEPLIDGPLKLD